MAAKRWPEINYLLIDILPILFIWLIGLLVFVYLTLYDCVHCLMSSVRMMSEFYKFKCKPCLKKCKPCCEPCLEKCKPCLKQCKSCLKQCKSCLKQCKVPLERCKAGLKECWCVKKLCNYCTSEKCGVNGTVCEHCHCASCKRLTCEEDCTCDNCHFQSRCSKQTWRSCSNQSPELGGSDATADTCTVCMKSDATETAFSKCCVRKCCWNFCGYLLTYSRQLSHSLVQLLFGARRGPIRESPKPTEKESEGLDNTIVYIDDKQIKPEFNSMRFFLKAKSVFLVIFYLSVLYDTFFIKTSLHRCDASIDCYLLDDNYNDYPIQDCTEILDNPNVTAICYTLVYDTTEAASRAGGLLTFSTLALSISSALIISVYGSFLPWMTKRCLKQCCTSPPKRTNCMKCCCFVFCCESCCDCSKCECLCQGNYECCCYCKKDLLDEDQVEKKKCCYNWLYFSFYILQCFTAFILCGGSIIFQCVGGANTEKTQFKQFGDFLGYFSFGLSLFFSAITPWNLLIDKWPKFKKEKESHTDDPELTPDPDIDNQLTSIIENMDTLASSQQEPSRDWQSATSDPGTVVAEIEKGNSSILV